MSDVQDRLTCYNTKPAEKAENCILRVGNFNYYFMPTTKWQCNKCGKQTTTGGNTPGQQSCPSGGYHVWARFSRFFKQIVDLCLTID